MANIKTLLGVSLFLAAMGFFGTMISTPLSQDLAGPTYSANETNYSVGSNETTTVSADSPSGVIDSLKSMLDMLTGLSTDNPAVFYFVVLPITIVGIYILVFIVKDVIPFT